MKAIQLLALLVLVPALRVVGAENQAALVRLYEEEVLAHKLYVELGKLHPDVRPFQNIPRSELAHREAMAGVLKAAGIALPKPDEGKGFVSPDLDATYGKWLAEGKTTVADACRVGARLEELDILDLRKAQEQFPAHKETFVQLEEASTRHFRAFHRNLVARGGSYTPAVMKPDEIRKLLADDEKDKAAAGCASPEEKSGTAKKEDRAAGEGRRQGWRGGR